MNKKILQKNWWILIVLLGCIIAFFNRYTLTHIPVVSNSDDTVTFSTNDIYFEQTWQPNVKQINSVSVPYIAQSEFASDIQLTIFSDDYSQKLVKMVQRKEFLKESQGTIGFVFDKVDVTIGERYHIRMCFQNETKEGSLELLSGSNYYGCSVGKEEVNQALAINIGAVKGSKLFWLASVLFTMSAITLMFMVCFKRKWEETVGITLIIEGLILYLFGLLGYLQMGIYVIILFSMIAFSVSAIIINRDNLYLRDLLSPGFWIFWLFFAIIVFANQNIWYGRFDEYSHWGLAVKDMFYYNSFAKHIDTTVLLPRYVPFATLIEYFYVYFNGMYSEDIVYIAFQVIMLSFSMILFNPIRKSKVTFCPLFLAAICIPPIFFNDISNCIYVDSLLGILTMYIWICYYSRENTVFPKMQIILGLTALVLTKDMGLVLAGLSAIAFALDAIWMKIKMNRKIFYQLLFPAISFGVVIGVWISWQVYMSIPVSYNDISSGESVNSQAETTNISFQGTVQSSGLSVDGILRLITGKGSDDQKQIIKNMLIKIFDGDMYYLGKVGFSYIDIMLISALIVLILCLFHFWGENNEKMIYLICSISAIGIIYCGVLCIMYLFAFPVNEALKLKSIERYLGSFLLAEVMTICYYGIERLGCQSEEKRKQQFIAIIITAFFIMVLPITNYVVKNRDQIITSDMVYWCEETEEIFRSFARRGDNAAFICSNAGTESYFIFRNTVSPVITERTKLNIVSSEELAARQTEWYLESGSEKSIAAEIVPLEEWRNYLSGCDYLFILHADEFFKESYQVLFLEPETIEDGSIYRVMKESNNISLMYVGRTGIKKYR